MVWRQSPTRAQRQIPTKSRKGTVQWDGISSFDALSRCHCPVSSDAYLVNPRLDVYHVDYWCSLSAYSTCMTDFKSRTSACYNDIIPVTKPQSKHRFLGFELLFTTAGPHRIHKFGDKLAIFPLLIAAGRPEILSVPELASHELCPSEKYPHVHFPFHQWGFSTQIFHDYKRHPVDYHN